MDEIRQQFLAAVSDVLMSLGVRLIGCVGLTAIRRFVNKGSKTAFHATDTIKFDCEIRMSVGSWGVLTPICSLDFRN